MCFTSEATLIPTQIPAVEIGDLDNQPVVRTRRYTDQGGRRPSRPIQYPASIIDEVKGKDDVVLVKNL